METEIWRPIKGYEGLYEVSNLGRVKSLAKYLGSKGGSLRPVKERILRQYLSNNGYWLVKLSKDKVAKGYLVHRLVAFAFQDVCGEWFEGSQVNHKDENTKNAAATNLEFCSVQYNNSYGQCMVSRKRSLTNGVMSKPLKAVHTKTGEVLRFPSLGEAGRQGYDKVCIWRTIVGQNEHHKGYKWYYEDSAPAT